jgi:hypothetical protein
MANVKKSLITIAESRLRLNGVGLVSYVGRKGTMKLELGKGTMTISY